MQHDEEHRQAPAPRWEGSLDEFARRLEVHEKLLPPPGGWSDDAPDGKSHWVTGWAPVRPACGIYVYYSGVRYTQPPAGAEVCQECREAFSAARDAADGREG